MRCFHWISIISSGNWKLALDNYCIINNPLIPILFISILSIIKIINTIIQEEYTKWSPLVMIYQAIKSLSNLMKLSCFFIKVYTHTNINLCFRFCKDPVAQSIFEAREPNNNHFNWFQELGNFLWCISLGLAYLLLYFGSFLVEILKVLPIKKLWIRWQEFQYQNHKRRYKTFWISEMS